MITLEASAGENLFTFVEKWRGWRMYISQTLSETAAAAAVLPA